MLSSALLAAILVVAVAFDLKERRIPNLLIIVGLLTALFFQGLHASWGGLLFSLQGFLDGLALLFLPFLWGGIGAGDVKLLAVVGAFQGPTQVFYTFLYMALWGGLIACLLLLWHRNLLSTLRRWGNGFRLGGVSFSAAARAGEKQIFFPYALAIALGALTQAVLVWWGI